MPHDEKLSRAAGFFADLVTLVFLVVLLLWGEWLLPSRDHGKSWAFVLPGVSPNGAHLACPAHHRSIRSGISQDLGTIPGEARERPLWH